jgi:hypothetical protein
MASKKIRWAVSAVVLVFGAMQLVRPERTNPPVKAGNTLEAQYEVPGEVKVVLERACADCHSNRTKWPWYSHVAPVSWLLAKHVKDGRRHVNFDDFQEDVSVKDFCQEMRIGTMPMKGYVLLHPEAKVAGAEIQAVCGWAQKAQAE